MRTASFRARGQHAAQRLVDRALGAHAELVEVDAALTRPLREARRGELGYEHLAHGDEPEDHPGADQCAQLERVAAERHQQPDPSRDPNARRRKHQPDAHAPPRTVVRLDQLEPDRLDRRIEQRFVGMGRALVVVVRARALHAQPRSGRRRARARTRDDLRRAGPGGPALQAELLRFRVDPEPAAGPPGEP